jgi:hypothetical protein
VYGGSSGWREAVKARERASKQCLLSVSLSRFLQEKIKERTHTHTHTHRGKRASKWKGENKKRRDEKAKRVFSVVNK